MKTINPFWIRAAHNPRYIATLLHARKNERSKTGTAPERALSEEERRIAYRASQRRWRAKRNLSA